MSDTAHLTHDLERAVERARELVADDRRLEAIDLLQVANSTERDPSVEEWLADLRRDAFLELDRDPATAAPRPRFDDPFPSETGLVELDAGEATSELVGGSIAHHGCVLIRNLLPASGVERLIGSIDHAFDGLLAAHDGADVASTTPWYRPLAANPAFPPRAEAERANPRWFRVCVGDSPRAMFDVVEEYERAGIGRLVSGVLGDRPAMTTGKWALRRMPKRKLAGWHQEAAVFQAGPLDALNVWLTLTEAGDDAPGFDVIPRREQAIHPTTDNFMLRPAVFEEVAGDAPIASPRYGPGDAMLFDDHLIHRTNTDDSMEGLRYSIESWFFKPSAHPIELGAVVY